MDHMRIRTIFLIDCSAEIAWQAAHTPGAAAQLYEPALHMSDKHGTLPTQFESGSRVEVALRLFGFVPVGVQRIEIEDIPLTQFPPGARTMRDAGRPLSGPLALLRGWNHEITVWPMGSRATVWHDELTINGAFAPLLSLGLRPMWRWRQAKLTRLARAWARDSEAG